MWGPRAGGESYKEEKTFGNDKYVCYLYFSNSFTGVYKCQTYRSVHLNTCTLLYVNYNSIKLFKKHSGRIQ